MARTGRNGIDYFPECNPHLVTRSRLGSSNDKIKYNAYRNISSGFISKKQVRKIIFERDNYKCVICGNTENLQIDHIMSVYYAFKNNIPINQLNCEDNLQTLCKHCNSSKNP
jgi:5-methylcytosine-specific restriction endonuclease McrA